MSTLNSASRTTTKLSIPHPELEDVTIVGVLEQWSTPSSLTNGDARKVALILHGSMGHKDYLFQKKLAHRLPIDSFRFDFQGNFESSGTMRMGGFLRDVEDIRVVVAYLVREYGYQIDLVIGHSRGSVSGLRWMCTTEEGNKVRGYVNVSGRYRMEKIYDSLSARAKADFETKGEYVDRAIVARKQISSITTRADLNEFMTFDSSYVCDRFPPTTHVLTLHGMQDRIVPPYDGMIYARIFGARTPGTHNLFYAEDADHNFTGQAELVVENVLEWWSALNRGDLKTGVWKTGVRGKL